MYGMHGIRYQLKMWRRLEKLIQLQLLTKIAYKKFLKVRNQNRARTSHSINPGVSPSKENIIL